MFLVKSFYSCAVRYCILLFRSSKFQQCFQLYLNIDKGLQKCSLVSACVTDRVWDSTFKNQNISPENSSLKDWPFLSYDKIVLIFVPWNRNLKIGIVLYFEWMSPHLKRKCSLSDQDRQSGKPAKSHVLCNCLIELKQVGLLVKGFVTLEFLPGYSWSCCCCWRLKMMSQLSVCID